MAGNQFKKLTRGEEFSVSATAWNTLMDVAQREYGGAGSAGGGGVGVGGDHVVCRVLNNSGAAVDRFAVLGVSDAAITLADNANDFKNVPIISGVTPTVADFTGYFVITLEPIRNGKIGRCAIAGMCPVQVNMLTSGDLWADVKDSDSTQLQSNPLGSTQILYVPSGTGTKWAWVRLGQPTDPRTVIVKKDGGADAVDNTHAATYTYSIYSPLDTSYANAVATGLTPKRARWNGFMVAAADGTYGLAARDTGGTVILLDAYGEARRTQPCS
jgi:hypothetical protein